MFLKRLSLIALALIIASPTAMAQDSQLVGQWVGQWEGVQGDKYEYGAVILKIDKTDQQGFTRGIAVVSFNWNWEENDVIGEIPKEGMATRLTFLRSSMGAGEVTYDLRLVKEDRLEGTTHAGAQKVNQDEVGSASPLALPLKLREGKPWRQESFVVTYSQSLWCS